MKALLWRVIGLTVLDAAALTVLFPTIQRVLLTPAAVSPGNADAYAAAVAEVGLFAVAVWLAVGLVASALSTVPGRTGRMGHTVSGALLPALLRRALAGGAGIGVLLAPVGPSIGTAVAHPVATHSSAAPSVPERPRHDRTPLPPPVWPTSAPSPTPRSAPQSQVRTGTTVTAGDSLWLIAARRLGPGATDAQLAAYWQRVYRQNSSVIGADPDLIRPGQRLTLPALPAEESAR